MSNLAEQLPELPPPGIYYNVPAIVYHSWPAVNSTLLKNYVDNPSTCREPIGGGDDIAVGSGIHAYSLQGEKGLLAECIIAPSSCAGRSKAAIEEKELLVSMNPGKTVLPPFYGTPAPGLPLMDVLMGVDKSLRNHFKVGGILSNSEKEVSLLWIDEEAGVPCKARLDIWAKDRVIWDLKKAREIKRFRWQIKDLHYELQAGHYFNGAVALGLDPIAFGFIPVEATPPYQVACGYLEEGKLEQGRYEAKRLIGLVKQSQMFNVWPNYPIPEHINSLHDITPDDLIEVW